MVRRRQKTASATGLRYNLILDVSPLMNRRDFLIGSALTTPLALPGADQSGSPGDISREAYIWGVPLVLQVTYLQRARERKFPMNRFTVSTGLASPDDKNAGPNVDTLYGFSWLDLRKEPIVLHVPDTHDRYYCIHLIDMYSNSFAYVGRRATGTKEGRYAICAQGWRGPIPTGVARIESPTSHVMALTRTLVRGPADLAAARAIQQEYTLSPLSQIAQPPLAPQEVVSAITEFPVLDLVAGGAKYFDEMGAGLAQDPPPARENAPLERFAKAGIGPNRRPSESQFASTLRESALAADALVKSTNVATQVNGWRVNYRVTPFIADRLVRASVNRMGPGVHIAQEALYFGTQTDAEGKPLTGTERYRMRFAPGQTPPVDAFWSLILYGADYFLVRNPINRYSISDRTEGLAHNPDGSLDIFIQREAPEQGRENWLPAAAGPFRLVLRTYQPRPEVLNQTWKPPVLERIA
jgi:hypothetical protein